MSELDPRSCGRRRATALVIAAATFCLAGCGTTKPPAVVTEYVEDDIDEADIAEDSLDQDAVDQDGGDAAGVDIAKVDADVGTDVGTADSTDAADSDAGDDQAGGTDGAADAVDAKADGAADAASDADGLGAAADAADAGSTDASDDAQDSADIADVPADVVSPEDVPADVPPSTACPGGVGCPCATEKDCQYGACAPTASGANVCATPCTADCAKGTTCVDVGGAKGCVSTTLTLCDPCQSDADCQNLGNGGAICVHSGSAGNFCGTACKAAADCTEGYTCLPGYDLSGKVIVQCQPLPGSACSCSGSAIVKGATTSCSSSEGCAGTRSCKADGLSACAAPAAKAEACDGIDNNCDGTTDGEGLCNDGVACTVDSCAGKGGCLFLPQLGVCEDGLVCTQDECGALGCTHAPNVAPCNDGNICTKSDACADGACTGAALDCGDGNPCTSDACEPSSGCVHAKLAGACEDGDKCTAGDACNNGVCEAGASASCDDGTPCTSDACAAQTGCTHAAVAGACSDGSDCTVGESCSGGVCKAASALACDDGNVCTTDSCLAIGGCQHANNSGGCTDSNACTIGDLCAAGACKPGAPAACDDGNPCTDDCNPASGCVKVANTAQCSDGNGCTSGDACKNSVCMPGAKLDCDDKTPCTMDGCTPDLGCTHTADDQAGCTDNSVCTIGDHCSGGLCLADSQKACDDGNPCTDDCDPLAGCSPQPNTVPCDDGNSCTLGDTCNGGSCKGLLTGCDDGNPCTDDGCVSGKGCAHVNNTATCPGSGLCVAAYQCLGGQCQAPPSAVCDDANPCTDDCGSKDACLHSNNVIGCQDGNACTAGDACTLGACMPGMPTGCDDANACTSDMCDGTSGCVHLANVVSCTDGDACTSGDLCKGGKCVAGLSIVCGGGDPCVAVCQPAAGCVPTSPGTPCNDGNACTSADACVGGACLGGPASTCVDGNICTDDSCDPASGCSFPDNELPCFGANPCTAGAKCSGGQCVTPGCDDKNPCTLDSCDGGQCLHGTQPGCVSCLDEAFAAAPDFSGKVSSVDAAYVAWQLSPGGLGTQPFALSAVWSGTGSGSAVVVATYQTAQISHAAPANLTFQLDATLGDAACGVDDLEVWLGSKQLKQVCASTGGTKTIVVALPADGTASPIEFRVRAGKGAGHSGAVTVDDIQVGSGCPPPDFMLCGLCPTGKACNTATGVCGYHALIDEVSTVGPGGTHDSFIELYNPGSGPMPLYGARLQWRPAGGAWQDVTGVAGMAAPDVPSHGFCLIATPGYSGAIAADLVLAANIDFGTSGALRLLAPDGKPLDLVGWGTAAPAYEGGAAAPAPADGSSIERRASATSTSSTMAAGGAEAKLGNGFDSDVSVFDWLARAKAEPQSLASPKE